MKEQKITPHPSVPQLTPAERDYIVGENAFNKSYYTTGKNVTKQIQQAADNYVGHPHEVDEGVGVWAKREVVVFTQNFPDDAGIMRVSIAHRPNPDGWDGKSITTGKVEHYTPKTYDKGGWNQPDVVYWLDVDLPKETED